MQQLGVLVVVCLWVPALTTCSKSDTKKANQAARSTPTPAATTDARAKTPPAQKRTPAPADAGKVAQPRLSPEQLLTDHLTNEYSTAETCFAWSTKGQTLVCHRQEEQNGAEMGSVQFFDRRGHSREYTYQFMEQRPLPSEPIRLNKAQVRRAKRRVASSDYKTIKLQYEKLLPDKTLRIGGAVLTRKRKIHITTEPATDIQDVSGFDEVFFFCNGRKKKLSFGEGSWSYAYVDAGFSETTIQVAVLPNGSLAFVLDGGWAGEGLSGTFTTATVYTKRALCVRP